jgi:hypothetical protein
MPDMFSPSDVERINDIASEAHRLIIARANAEFPDDPQRANAMLNALAMLTAHTFGKDETQFYVATAINDWLAKSQHAIHWRMASRGGTHELTLSLNALIAIRAAISRSFDRPVVAPADGVRPPAAKAGGARSPK